MDKILDIARGGRTILFVSHNMASVKSTCSRSVVLKEGTIYFDGNVNDAIDHYNNQNHAASDLPVGEIPRSKYGKDIRFETFHFSNDTINFGENIKFHFKLKAFNADNVFGQLDFGFAVFDSNHSTIIHLSNRFNKKNFQHEKNEDEYTVWCENNLKPGVYFLTLFLANEFGVLDWLEEKIQFEIEDDNPYNFENTSMIQGVILPSFDIEKSSKT